MNNHILGLSFYEALLFLSYIVTTGFLSFFNLKSAISNLFPLTNYIYANDLGELFVVFKKFYNIALLYCLKVLLVLLFMTFEVYSPFIWLVLLWYLPTNSFTNGSVNSLIVLLSDYYSTDLTYDLALALFLTVFRVSMAILDSYPLIGLTTFKNLFALSTTSITFLFGVPIAAITFLWV